MDVLVNASNLTKGGGVQVAASFVAESLADPKGFTWHYALSRQVADELHGLGIQVVNAHVFGETPAKSRAQRERLLDLEKEVSADAVFTLFGPAYVRFSGPHLLGVAVGWVTHSTWIAYRTLPGWMARLKKAVASAYKGWWLRFADRWVVEAENARNGLQSRLGVSGEHIDIVPNACSTAFANVVLNPAARPDKDAPVRLLYVSAYYPHKNIEIVPKVAAELARAFPERKFIFVLTLPAADAEQIAADATALGVADSIANVGSVPQSKLIEMYRESDICFMPSVLETFSATYVEAMATGRPIVASDLDFAHAVCGDSAVYFDPESPQAAARAIVSLIEDENVWQNCINRGRARLELLPTARQRYGLYVNAIHATAARNTRIAAETEGKT